MRTRARRYPDWLDTIPGWSFRKRVNIISTGALTSDITTRGPFAASGYAGVVAPRGREVISDENHISELKDFKHFEFHGDIGGEFELTRSGVLCSAADHHLHSVTQAGNFRSTNDYFGPVVALNPTTIPLPSVPSPTNLGPVGTEAIYLTKPTNNVANLATDLVETRQEGLPHLYGASLWEAKTLSAKAAGSEYLNSEFGWKPLVSDIRGASYAAANAHKLLSAYERNSHKIVRRRYEFPVVTTEHWDTGFVTNVRGTAQGVDSSITSNGPAVGRVDRCTRTYKRQWFSGAFTYHLPIGYNSRNKLISAASQAGPLLGIELTPEVVWNATPWTWAIDWFSNAGDVVSIVSDMAVDGLVIKYGYVMEHQVTSQTYYFVGDDGYLPAQPSRPFPITSFVETKRRKRATPFGFEVGWEGLSLRQLAISAALGLTRW